VWADARWRAQAEGPALVIIDLAEGRRAQVLPVRTLDDRGQGGVAEIHAVAARRSFVVVFEQLAELWEISTDPNAAPVYDGLVHDYRMGEAIARPGFLNPRRTPLDAPLHGLWIDGRSGFLIGRKAPVATDGGKSVLQLWQLDVRRRIDERPSAGPAEPARTTVRRTPSGLRFEVPFADGRPPLALGPGRD
jgi:hypothetical protein